MPVHGIHDDAPAARWEDAFLGGNGETGVLVHGDPHHERIVHTHHRFTLPDPAADTRTHAVADRLEQVRDAVLAGRSAEAQSLFTDGRELPWTQQFHPGPVLHLDTPEAGPWPGAEAGRVRDYRRAVSYDTGELTVSWTDPAGPHLRRTVVSRPAGAVVTEITGAPVALTVRWADDLPGRPAAVTWTAAAEVVGETEALLRFEAAYPRGVDGGSGGGYRARARVVVTGGGSVRVTSDGAVHIAGADRVLLLARLDRDPSFDPGPPPVPLADLPPDYPRLLAEHAAVHGDLFGRSLLDLGASGPGASLPVAEVLAREASGSPADPLLCEALYASGRHLLISATGVLPPRLSGLWIGAWGAAWSGDFTTDANLNLQLAALLSTGVPELLAAQVQLIAGQLDDWRANAAAVYGARGLLAPSHTDGEHGRLFHASAEWPWTMWTAGADWLLQPLEAYWQATGDDAFLRDTLAPWLVEAALFYEDFLTRRDAGGRIVLVPSLSPEIGPTGSPEQAPAGTPAQAPTQAPTQVGVNSTMDLAAARHALTAAADAVDHLGLAQPAAPRWRELADALPPLRVDAHGALAEWAWEGLATHPDHRHVSHLHPVWPLHQITPETTPALAAAARAALAARGDENLSAHGSLHRALCAARLRDPEALTVNLGKILGQTMIFRSLMTSHNPGLRTFNADAAHTLPAVFAEALADGRPGALRLLPAVPADWRTGRVTGLLTEAGVRIEELRWDLDRSTLTARLAATGGRTLRVRVTAPGDGSADRTVILAPGKPQALRLSWAANRDR